MFQTARIAPSMARATILGAVTTILTKREGGIIALGEAEAVIATMEPIKEVVVAAMEQVNHARVFMEKT
eukprot:8694482-Ditylum_brightwellii.AAC.1